MNRINVNEASREDLIAIIKQLRNQANRARQQQQQQGGAEGSDDSVELRGKLAAAAELVKQLRRELAEKQQEVRALTEQNVLLSEKSASDEETINVLLKQLEEMQQAASASGDHAAMARQTHSPRSSSSPDGILKGRPGCEQATAASASGGGVFTASVVESGGERRSGVDEALARKTEEVADLQQQVKELLEVNSLYTAIVMQHDEAAAAPAPALQQAGDDRGSEPNDMPQPSATWLVQRHEELERECADLRRLLRRSKSDALRQASCIEALQADLMHLRLEMVTAERWCAQKSSEAAGKVTHSGPVEQSDARLETASVSSSVTAHEDPSMHLGARMRGQVLFQRQRTVSVAPNHPARDAQKPESLAPLSIRNPSKQEKKLLERIHVLEGRVQEMEAFELARQRSYSNVEQFRAEMFATMNQQLERQRSEILRLTKESREGSVPRAESAVPTGHPVSSEMSSRAELITSHASSSLALAKDPQHPHEPEPSHTPDDTGDEALMRELSAACASEVEDVQLGTSSGGAGSRTDEGECAARGVVSSCPRTAAADDVLSRSLEGGTREGAEGRDSAAAAEAAVAASASGSSEQSTEVVAGVSREAQAVIDRLQVDLEECKKALSSAMLTAAQMQAEKEERETRIRGIVSAVEELKRKERAATERARTLQEQLDRIHQSEALQELDQAKQSIAVDLFVGHYAAVVDGYVSLVKDHRSRQLGLDEMRERGVADLDAVARVLDQWRFAHPQRGLQVHAKEAMYHSGELYHFSGSSSGPAYGGPGPQVLPPEAAGATPPADYASLVHAEGPPGGPQSPHQHAPRWAAFHLPPTSGHAERLPARSSSPMHVFDVTEKIPVHAASVAAGSPSTRQAASANLFDSLFGAVPLVGEPSPWSPASTNLPSGNTRSPAHAFGGFATAAVAGPPSHEPPNSGPGGSGGLRDDYQVPFDPFA